MSDFSEWAYFDYTATTPVDPIVLQTYLTAMQEHFANTGGAYALGYAAKETFAATRAKFAELIHADAREIVFTSGATESDNLALQGAAFYHGAKNPRVISVQTEHKAILDTLGSLTTKHVAVEVLPVEATGLLNLDVLKEALQTPATLVSVMAVNNETGVCQPIREIADIVHAAGSKLHVDAAQALGKIPVDVSAWDADMVSFSGHKLYAPKGIGALYVRRLPKMRIAPLIYGGGQQFGRRSGTIPLPLVMAFSKALGIAVGAREARFAHVLALQKQLVAGLPPRMKTNIALATVPHVPHILSIDTGENVLNVLPEASAAKIAFSAGSACQSAATEGSHVLKAMGLERESTQSIRVSLSHLTTAAEVERLGDFLRRRQA